jgi:hypothetical protein
LAARARNRRNCWRANTATNRSTQCTHPGLRPPTPLAAPDRHGLSGPALAGRLVVHKRPFHVRRKLGRRAACRLGVNDRSALTSLPQLAGRACSTDPTQPGHQVIHRAHPQTPTPCAENHQSFVGMHKQGFLVRAEFVLQNVVLHSRPSPRDRTTPALWPNPSPDDIPICVVSRPTAGFAGIFSGTGSISNRC